MSERSRHRPFSKVLKNAVRLATATGIAQCIVLVATPILTRLYTPADFATLGVITAIAVLISVVSTFGFTAAIVSESDDQSADDLVLLCALGVSLFSIASFGLAAPFFVGLYPPVMDGAFENYGLWPLAVAIAALGFLRIFREIEVRDRRFDRVGTTVVVNSAGSATFQVLAGLISAGTIGLLFGYVGGLILSIGPVLRRGQNATRRSLRRANIWCRMRRVISKHWRFPAFHLWSNLAEHASTWLPIILTAVVFDPHVAGAFFLVHRLFRLPLALISSNLATPLYRDAVWQRDNQPAELAVTFRHLITFLALVGLPIPLVLMGYGPDLLGYILGDSWREAGIIAADLSTALFAQFIAIPLAPFFIVLNLHWLRTLAELTRLGAILSLFALAGTVIPYDDFFMAFGLTVASVFCLSTVVLAIAVGRHARRARA